MGTPMKMPSYKEMLKTDKNELWPYFDRAPYPPDHIKEGMAATVNTPYIGIMGSAISLIRLPDDHPWLSVDPLKNINHGGFQIKCIARVMSVEHFPLKTSMPFKKEVKQWLMSKFTADEIKKLFMDDMVAKYNKDTPKKWLCLTYDHLINPGWCTSSIVKLSHEDRKQDVCYAVAAALVAYNEWGQSTHLRATTINAWVSQQNALYKALKDTIPTTTVAHITLTVPPPVVPLLPTSVPISQPTTRASNAVRTKTKNSG